MTEVEKQMREIADSKREIRTPSTVISITSFAIPAETRRLIDQILADRVGSDHLPVRRENQSTDK